jgi:spoIIIJ-associated protein
MQADMIRTTVESLLKALGIDVDSIEVSEGSRTVIAVSSPDSKLLIGNDGENLQALNTIARRLIETRMRAASADTDGFLSFLIDVNGYHEAKLEELRSKARAFAERAKLFKHEMELPPMTSYERLVVHELFANDPDIETVSTGDGKFRHIVLRYKQA